MRFSILAIAMFFALPAAAQLYVCQNNGKISISGIKLNDQCRLQNSYERGNQQPAVKPKAAAPLTPAKTAPAAPAAPAAAKKYPTVSAATQKTRDLKRGKILRHELENELHRQQTLQEQIAQIKQIDSESEENALLISHLENQLHIHTQNITAIRQEIERL